MLRSGYVAIKKMYCFVKNNCAKVWQFAKVAVSLHQKEGQTILNTKKQTQWQLQQLTLPTNLL